MKKILIQTFFHSLFLLLFLQNSFSQGMMVDEKCTPETRNLYENLKRLAGNAILFGNQDALSSGYNWKEQDGRCDVKEVSGDYPALAGWDISGVETQQWHNYNWVKLDKIKEYVSKIYEMGGVNTFCWHLNNPVYPLEGVKSNQKNTANLLFIDEVALKRYKLWLDRIANYVTSLRGKHGELIPIIFRPFHEANGDWFWWGKGKIDAESYVKLWRFTVEYLRDTRNVHNLIYCYAPNGFHSDVEYLEKYPGVKYVDVLGFDQYWNGKTFDENRPTIEKMQAMVKMLSSIAKEKNKLWAVTETGWFDKPDYPDFWTKALYPIIKNSGVSYVMLWTNMKEMQSSVYPGHITAGDFKQFHDLPEMYFQNKIEKKKIYTKW